MPALINSDDGIVSGSSGLKTTGANDGILALQNNGTTNVTVTAAGDVGFGTNSPIQKVHIAGSGNMYASGGATWYTGGDLFIRAGTSGALRLGANDTNDLMRLASNGQQSSVVPGGGTLYPAFNSRAWVNFNGTGTVAIRASGNVSSITDNTTGDYTVNFTTAMPDTNYALTFGGTGNPSTPSSSCFAGGIRTDVSPTTSTVRFVCGSVGTSGGITQDPQIVNVSIFR